MQSRKAVFEVPFDDKKFKTGFLAERTGRDVKKAEVGWGEWKKEPWGQPKDVSGAFNGPWAKYIGEEALGPSGPSHNESLRYNNDKAQEEKVMRIHKIEHGKEKTVCHTDYVLEEECGKFAEASKPPQGKLLASCVGHLKTITSVSHLPRVSHMFLSSSLDGLVKLWKFQGEISCVRTFYGHNKPVKEIVFSPDGKAFCSVSLDKYVKSWELERGGCLRSMKLKKMPFCSIFMDSNTLLVGLDDGSICQWDLRSSQMVLEYEGMRSVNSIVRLGDASFVSSSDDGFVKTWDVGCLVPKRTKTFQELGHLANGKMSLDNNHVYFQSSTDKVASFPVEEERQYGLRLGDLYKTFSGHSTKGYSCSITSSGDNRFVASGDAKGFVYIWDAKSSQLANKIKAHDQACVVVDWHPWKSHQMVTGSWDGTIKIWI